MQLPNMQSVSGIWARYFCSWWFNFRLEPIYTTATAASKNDAPFKSGQNRLKNNHHA